MLIIKRSKIMEKTDRIYKDYVSILKEELIPAMGCTEPIAIALAAARARELLCDMPESVHCEISGSIIKNVKSVVVPNTGGQKGIEAAAAAGIIAGDSSKKLEVISSVSEKQLGEITSFIKNTPITIKHVENGPVFDILVTLAKGGKSASVRIANFHTNIVLEKVNETVLLELPVSKDDESHVTDRRVLTMEGIWDFALNCDVDDVKEILDRQIEYNMAIAEEGLKGDYGANIGNVISRCYVNSIENRAKAAAAAASDARMNGCELPVIINSGSGNQGIAASVPVIVYARELKASDEKLYRALCISNLTAIHQKTGIGCLSAYCGAVNAGAGAGCGIAYLLGGGYEAIIHTLVNALAIVSGIICDGAKASCAAKIAASIDAGLMGYNMYRCGQQFIAGDGIVGKGVEANIENVGRLGKDGMRETNEEIINIMINNK